MTVILMKILPVMTVILLMYEIVRTRWSNSSNHRVLSNNGYIDDLTLCSEHSEGMWVHGVVERASNITEITFLGAVIYQVYLIHE